MHFRYWTSACTDSMHSTHGSAVGAEPLCPRAGRGMHGIPRRKSAGRGHTYAQLCREVREVRGVRMIRRHLQILKQMLTYSSRMITDAFGIKTSFVPVYHYHFSD